MECRITSVMGDESYLRARCASRDLIVGVYEAGYERSFLLPYRGTCYPVVEAYLRFALYRVVFPNRLALGFFRTEDTSGYRSNLYHLDTGFKLYQSM